MVVVAVDIGCVFSTRDVLVVVAMVVVVYVGLRAGYMVVVVVVAVENFGRVFGARCVLAMLVVMVV